MIVTFMCQASRQPFMSLLTNKYSLLKGRQSHFCQHVLTNNDSWCFKLLTENLYPDSDRLHNQVATMTGSTTSKKILHSP